MALHRKNKIFIVDDHPLVREWLANLVNQQTDLIVCGEADEKSVALKAIVTTKPDLAIVDISLKTGSGIELIKDLKSVLPDVLVIVLSMHDEMQYAERALRAGARGSIMKRDSTKNIIVAIRQVLAGKPFVSERVTAMMAEKFISGEPAAGDSPETLLSDRELQVFQQLGQGCETRKIAESLNISIKTVQAYCARIKDKLNLANATELLCEAVRAEERRNNA